MVTPTKYTKSGEAGFTVTVGLCIRGWLYIYIYIYIYIYRVISGWIPRHLWLFDPHKPDCRGVNPTSNVGVTKTGYSGSSHGEMHRSDVSGLTLLWLPRQIYTLLALQLGVSHYVQVSTRFRPTNDFIHKYKPYRSGLMLVSSHRESG